MTTFGEPWSTVRRWDPTRSSSSASGGFERVTLKDVESGRARSAISPMSAWPRRSRDVPGEYAAAGVDLVGAEAAKARIGRLVASTRTSLSTGKVGAFGGMVRVPAGHAEADTRAQHRRRRHQGAGRAQGRALRRVGEDLVNHSVNDILVHGATPIAFMDYVAGSGLDVEQIAGIVEGIARGCRAHGMALAGGETAQMPGLYQPGTYDLAGTIIGVVEEDRALHGEGLSRATSSWATRRPDCTPTATPSPAGWCSTGWASGSTTARRRRPVGRRGTPRGAPSYVPERCCRCIDRMHGLAHITGGGIAGNLVRILPAGCEAVVDPEAWELPAIFATLQQAGSVSIEDKAQRR